jgi:hypothetical protein
MHLPPPSRPSPTPRLAPGASLAEPTWCSSPPSSTLDKLHDQQSSILDTAALATVAAVESCVMSGGGDEKDWIAFFLSF